jgi:hypothetical protein
MEYDYANETSPRGIDDERLSYGYAGIGICAGYFRVSESLSPSYDQAAPSWDYYGMQGSPRYYNEVPAQQSNAARSHHRASTQH